SPPYDANIRLTCNFVRTWHRLSRHLHSFPTRRSSDLFVATTSSTRLGRRATRSPVTRCPSGRRARSTASRCFWPSRSSCRAPRRSEEHTSELQSRSDLVCRLLLEKKKTTTSYAGSTKL